jgi:hypothetical protein
LLENGSVSRLAVATLLLVLTSRREPGAAGVCRIDE